MCLHPEMVEQIAKNVGHKQIAIAKVAVHTDTVWLIADCGKRYCMSLVEWDSLTQKVRRKREHAEKAESFS